MNDSVESAAKRRLFELMLRQKGPDARTMPQLHHADGTGPLPLSRQQERMWTMAHASSGAIAVCHAAIGMKLHGALDERALRAALDGVVARHDLLRTVYLRTDGAVRQVVHPDGRFTLRLTDVSGLEADDRAAALRQEVHDEWGAPFDLTVGPVIRGRLVRIAEHEHALVIIAHRIIIDGWSRSVLMQELLALYRAHHEEVAPELPPLEIQYADYARWEREWSLTEDGRAGVQYWTRQLAGAPPLLELPTDHQRPPVQSFASDSLDFVLSARRRAEIQPFARRFDVTVYMLLYAVWAIVLSRLTGREDVIIGVIVANRPHRQVEPLIGQFVNYLPTRLQIREDVRVRRLLQQVKETMLAAFTHQFVAFGDVVDSVRPPQSPSHFPIFQVALMLENIPERIDRRMPGIRLGPLKTPYLAEFDVYLSLKEQGDRVDATLTYATDLFDRRTMVRWAETFDAILTNVLRDPDRMVNGLSSRSIAPPARTR